ncbi:oxidoreductase, short chain dehydrogenase/reductase family protein [Besnoitia besnoiti]|uniref:Oxidoreductase, short chain dehydrogenase/reductase family protein n=1 Tax=Besnoitia besnoiti TaxID=94643 RepID=A0A2A9MKY1_BESBE|nr:oxidoreductase, short chain dehydrogenase/reductase family protein [Besnoitia besnoiti]PFH38619.1 oxidoreductase, short chain dehydrogenase/reductase family protein [Besnoitia besnoiti]
MEKQTLFASKSLIFLVGASRGYGRALAVEAAKKWKSVHADAQLRLVFVGRDESGMKETGEAAKKELESLSYAIHTLDVAAVDDAFDKLTDLIFASEDLPAFDAVYLLHNAGWVRPTCYLMNASGEEIRRSVDLNLTSFSILTSRFLRRLVESLPQAAEASAETQRTVRIIQVSSLASIEPFASLPMYCTVKAARDMLLRAVAAEMEVCDKAKTWDFKTLNWAPGQMVTDMQREVQECEDANIRRMARDASYNVDLGVSACLMWQLVAEDAYQSGSHVDVTERR